MTFEIKSGIHGPDSKGSWPVSKGLTVLIINAGKITDTRLSKITDNVDKKTTYDNMFPDDFEANCLLW